MNVLILSVGTRNKIVQYFKREFNACGGVVVATDCCKYAPAIYDADRYYIVPRIDAENYIDNIVDICKKEKIDCLFSLIDPELSLIAKNRHRFAEVGATPIVSDYDVVEMSFNKLKMYGFCRNNGIGTVKTYASFADFERAFAAREIYFPVFVKPAKGSCSINIQKIENLESLRYVCESFDDLIIQEFMSGVEIGVDVYVDLLSKEAVSVFTKKKLLMRAGETDKSISFKDEKLFVFIENFVKAVGYAGHIDIDIFEKDGQYYVSEVNPRFGGGYPHAYECGCNFPKYILNNIKGIANEREVGNYKEGVVMMKYLEPKIIDFRQ